MQKGRLKTQISGFSDDLFIVD